MRGEKGMSRQEFKDQILTRCKKIAADNDIKALKATITDMAPPSLGIIPFKKTTVAVISVYSSATFEDDTITSSQEFRGKYTVTEAIPVAYQQS